MIRPEPCGSCPNCLVAVEVKKMIEFVDARLKPAVEAAAERVTEAKWRRSDDAYRRELKSYKLQLEQWLDQRSRIFTPEVVCAMTCPRTLTVIIKIEPEIPAPREVSARPTEFLLPREVGSARCALCGQPAEAGLVAGAWAVCPKCFGRE
jgi:hypothetical protein